MCGVFGYVGAQKSDLSGYLLSGLTNLEYRGYDSSGIAVFSSSRATIVKEVGELVNLRRKLKDKHLSGKIGIGHTRWATHGGVTRANAHPHSDCRGEIVVVHNGIIENYQEIKKELIRKGHRFVSQTDTEVFPHLIEERLKKTKNFVEAVRLAFNEIEGLNAVVAMRAGEMVTFRRGSPIVGGVTKEGYLVSSDLPALSMQTEKIILLDENEGLYASNNELYKIEAKSGKRTKAVVQRIAVLNKSVSRANYPHFLLKEIYEEPEVLGRLAATPRRVLARAETMVKQTKRVFFTACGTAYHSGLAAGYLLARRAKIPLVLSHGSEFPYGSGELLERDCLLLVASQSGETMDTLEAVRLAKRKGVRVLALANVMGSTLTRLADDTLNLKAGPERAVVSTKAYVAKLAAFLLLVYGLTGQYQKGVRLIRKTSRQMAEFLGGGGRRRIKLLAKRLKGREHIYLIGRGVNLATALEGALKIKEASYIHAEGFAAGELKHGVIALIEKGTPCIVIAPDDETYGEMISNAMEIKVRGGFIIGISPRENEVFDFWLPVPESGTASVITNIIPLQLLAYELALARGLNPDKPRNLAKSVTVK